MKINLLILSLALMLALAPATPAFAQTANGQGNWPALQTLSTGDKLRVEMKSGERVEGKFGSVSETALALAHDGKNVTLDRAEIRRVYRTRGSSQGKWQTAPPSTFSPVAS
ncbi:MAG: hypothetical protein LC754_18590 [Acidobacteria bacterium]|nr:hypothetical protein [Acidobacteriota bacterium]